MPDRADYGSDNLARHHVVKPELTGRGHAVRTRVKDGCELDRLAMKGWINPYQHSAGASLSRDLHGARLLGVKTTSFGQSISGGTPGDAQATAMDRVGDAIRKLDWTVGEPIRLLTVNACLSLVELSALDDLLAVRQGLDALVHHYDRRPAPLLRSEDLIA